MNYPTTISIRVYAFFLAVILCISSAAGLNPKREFRGAWLHTVFIDQYRQRSTSENKIFIIQQLDKLKQAGINAIFFQVRPQSDAFYDSKLEPWSRFLTDGGKEPVPYWDPLQFIIDEAHARGMELHAWLNPYRLTSSKTQRPPNGHIYYKHPERFVNYDGKLYFDPGIPENRSYIEEVVTDIVNRYDVDGIHFDDYFYPYPVNGKPFPDDKSYTAYGNGMSRDDWRRQNVNMLISALSTTIKELKPWIRFGVSPFGIWRNAINDPRGSRTNGLQNYDDLYADVLLWAENGWVDYLIPQLYWEREHPRASYDVLAKWWNDAVNNRHIYIGQHAEVTMNKCDIAPSQASDQLISKIGMTRQATNIQGSCWWPGYSVADNYLGIADSLHSTAHSTVALPPEYPWISTDMPDAPGNLIVNNQTLSWETEPSQGTLNDCVRFVIYRFDNDENFDLDDASKIVALTSLKQLPVNDRGYYIVTALNRVNTESFPSEPIYIK